MRDRALEVDLIAVQDHRLVIHEARRSAEDWAKVRGYSLRVLAAISTGDHAMATSAGVAVGTRRDIGQALMAPRELRHHSPRLAALEVSAVLKGGVVFVSGYQDTWDGGSVCFDMGTLNRLEDLGRFLRLVKKPWILAMDWQREPPSQVSW